MLDKEIREPLFDFLEEFYGNMIHMLVCRGRRQIMMSCVM